MKRNRGRGPTDNARNSTSSLKDAEDALQKAERRRGLQALPACKEAVEKYREVLNARHASQLSDQEVCSAWYGLGTSLQYSAECTLAGSRSCGNEEVKVAEESAIQSSRLLLREAVKAYKQVKDGSGNMQTDAMIDCGNALSQLAEVSQQHEAFDVLFQAVQVYETALSKSEDTTVYSNLGDVLVTLAEQQWGAGRQGEGRENYSKAMQAYSQACSISSSETGDDLPGLLHNWGVGLHSAGTHMKDVSILKEAAEKLTSAKDFERGDVVVINALGDTLVALADAATDSAEKRAWLLQAQQQGFNAALHIDRRNTDALIGSAEVEMQLGKLSVEPESLDHFRSSMQAYAQAVQQPTKLGGFRDRCDVRYNYACAAVLCGNIQAAISTLEGLLADKAISLGDITADADLQALHHSDWLQQQCAKADNPEAMSS